MKRYEKQCINCICFYSNWDCQVRKDMEDCPGEECSQGMNPYTNKSCHSFQPIEN
jgi:hypothetical protein